MIIIRSESWTVIDKDLDITFLGNIISIRPKSSLLVRGAVKTFDLALYHVCDFTFQCSQFTVSVSNFEPQQKVHYLVHV